MAAYSHTSDMYYDEPLGRSPRPLRQPNLQRHVPRPFDGYNAPGARFGVENGGSNLRYDNLRDTFNAPMQNGSVNNVNFPYDVGAAQTWNSTAPSLAPYGGSMSGMQNGGAFGPARGLRGQRGRAEISNYFDQSTQGPQAFSSHEHGQRTSVTPLRDSSADGDDELIPTAIVIKNIPFAVKKEALVELMTGLNLPLPYAFNYHFDNGVFRGLAFANFTSPEETRMVIGALNHYELNNRKLRVEYKKMLPLYERERIEREKRERRGQLEEQHRPMPAPQLASQVSIPSLIAGQRNTPSPNPQGQSAPEVDMNDPKNIDFYSEILLFKNDLKREVLIFPNTVAPVDRRTIHTLAHRLGLQHVSRGNDDQRQVHIFRPQPGSNTSPPNPALPDAFQGHDGYRRNLSRAATTDFNEGRQYEPQPFNTLRGQSSVGFLDVDTNGFRYADANLRGAKSFHDLRHYNASPAPSSASFPTALQTNGARLQALNDTEGSNTPTLTPTGPNNGLGLPNDENFLINGMSSMSIGNGQGNQNSPQRRGRYPFSTWDEPQSFQATAPIGSNRSVSLKADSASQERNPMRQSRGPSGVDRGTGFRRQNGRGSDELRNAASIINE